MNTKVHQIKLSIPMLSEMELAAAQTAEALAEYMDLDVDRIDETVMALIEACLFTFQNRETAQRAHICFRVWEDQLEIYLHTLGEDVDFDLAIDRGATGKPFLEAQKSWGIRIVEALMDQTEVVSWPEGILIRMVKKRTH